MRALRLCCALIALLTVPVATAPPVPAASKAEEVGLSTERLQRIHEVVERHVNAQDVSGAVTLIERRGRIAHFEVQGLMDIESKKPMAKDTIFRLASMSKPITAVAVMMMVEEGKVRLTDLLTHTSGLMSGGVSGAEQAKLAPRGPNDTLANCVPKLALTPLDFQPGTLWRYSGLYGFDVLARIVEIAAGQPYDQFLKPRIFDPLGMKDTGFAPTPERMARVATVYGRGPNGLVPAPNSNQLISSMYFSASGGLMSTAEDYLQFAQMLVNGGTLNGKRCLGPKTVELMTSNHTGDMVNGQFGRPARGMGFALGVQVWLDPVAADRRVSPGSYG